MPSIDELLTDAAGRWLAILSDAGLPAELLDGRGHPCINCRGRDRFAAWPDVAARGAVHCRGCFTKGCDPKPGDGLATLRWLLDSDTATACRWLADWLGVTGRTAKRPKTRPVVSSIRLNRDEVKPARDLASLANRCHDAMKPDWWERLAVRLNLPAAVLIRLRVGWMTERNATTWPMVDEADNIIGIRLRCIQTGRKWSVRGGSAGLFIPSELPQAPERLFIAEGPTDTAAVLSLGLPVIGRASATGAVLTECKTVRRFKPTECIIIADGDNAGRRGAQTLMVPLLTCCRAVRIIAPPDGIGDVRDWVARGASAADIIAAVDAAKPRSLSVAKAVKP
ncbi:hypothetical protein [Rubripirellula obstinata]|uniref:hypothetical protein n=1 Tax=Rubripirellula obstinata TaxID=406547 RepID=UPI00083445CF|nr:hypothetical protein [Rubripirellula obstinata]